MANALFLVSLILLLCFLQSSPSEFPLVEAVGDEGCHDQGEDDDQDDDEGDGGREGALQLLALRVPGGVHSSKVLILC